MTECSLSQAPILLQLDLVKGNCMENRKGELCVMQTGRAMEYHNSISI